MRISKRKKGNIVIIDIKGEIRFEGKQESSIRNEVIKFIEAGNLNILLNLNGVDFIDSWGIGEIVACFALVKNSGGRLKISNPSERLSLILRYSRITTMIETIEREEDFNED